MELLKQLAEGADPRVKEVIQMVCALNNAMLKALAQLSLARMVELDLLPLTLYEIVEPIFQIRS